MNFSRQHKTQGRARRRNRAERAGGMKDWKEDLVRESIGFEIWNGEHEEQTEENGLSYAERVSRRRAAMWERIRKGAAK